MRQHVIRSGGTKHGLHALLTLFTCGLWAPFWLLAALFTSKKTKTVVPEQPQVIYVPMPPGQQSWPPHT